MVAVSDKIALGLGWRQGKDGGRAALTTVNDLHLVGGVVGRLAVAGTDGRRRQDDRLAAAGVRA
jgi:hypothetical protein